MTQIKVPHEHQRRSRIVSNDRRLSLPRQTQRHVVLPRGLDRVAELISAHIETVRAECPEDPFTPEFELSPLCGNPQAMGRELGSRWDMQADFEEFRVAVDAHAVRQDLAVVLSISTLLGGRQQFSCRCCGRDMAHRNPP